MANLGALVGRELTEDEQEHIDSLQSEIDEIWSRRGNFKIEEDAWKSMPLFMETITEEDVATNASCAALASILYDEVPSDEVALNRKEQGNKALVMAQNPEQVNKENMARAAAHCYTEGIAAKCSDVKLNAVLYANRSLAHFIIQNFGHGLQDAQKAIILQPEYTKAYYRAAKCAEKIRKYDMALSLIKMGVQTEAANADQKTMIEFEELRKLCEEGREAAAKKVKSDTLKSRAKAAESSTIMRRITSHGIKMFPKCEVSSEQSAQLGGHKPYFDDNNLLHVPILFMYDEYQMTDYMADVGTDVVVIDIIDDLMPFPWDDRGRYAKLDDIVVVYKIDDGLAMPKYYEMDPSWTLLENMRQEMYLMPALLPVLHVVCRTSELLVQWGLRKSV
jgi:hypothetical protein